MAISQKLCFVGFMALIRPGSLTQLVVAIILAVGYMVAHTQANPFVSDADNLVGLAAR